MPDLANDTLDPLSANLGQTITSPIQPTGIRRLQTERLNIKFDESLALNNEEKERLKLQVLKDYYELLFEKSPENLKKDELSNAVFEKLRAEGIGQHQPHVGATTPRGSAYCLR